MKTLLLTLSCTFLSPVFAQTTLILQPGAEEGKDAKVFSNSPSNNYGEDQDFISAAWTWGGTPGLLRSYLQFDLSSIPDTALIISAKLSLFYNDESPSNGQEGENATYLRRVIEDWNESTINWDSKPDATTENQVYLSESISLSEDYTNIDVKDLVQDMIENPDESFGFLMRLEDEMFYASMKFCTSDFEDADKRPLLEIIYKESYGPNDTIIIQDSTIIQDTSIVETPILDTVGFNCINLQPSNAYIGIDTKIWDLDPTNNFGNDQDFISATWTWDGLSGKLRSLIKFDLSGIPSEAIIESAYISLFYNYESTSNGQEGENTALLRRITTPWEENVVTWNTQPSTTSVNEVILDMSSTIDQNYIDIDVTDLVVEMVISPDENYGFLFRQVEESTNRSMKFYSSDADVSENKKPKLLVCYSLDTTLSTSNIFEKTNIDIYPNPFKSQITISGITPLEFYSIEMYDITGRKIDSYLPEDFETNGENIIIENLEALMSGVYVMQIRMTNNEINIAKIIK